MTKPQIEEMKNGLRKAAKILNKKDITISEYKPIAEEHNLAKPQKIVDNIGWNKMKSMSFDIDFPPKSYKYNFEEKIEAIKRCMNIYGEDPLYKEYVEFSKDNNVPSISSLIDNYTWVEIKKIAREEATEEGIDNKYKRNEFCKLCVYKDSCTINVADCVYWKEFNDEV